MLTKPVTSAKWLTATTVAASFGRGDKKRSTLLTAIDDALLAYEQARPAGKLGALHQLFDAYEAWYASKKHASDGSVKSIRNNGNQMSVFEAWLREEQARLLPVPEDGWGNGPNCYAFAMKCQHPEGHGMTPGIAAGSAATTRGIEGDQVAYARRLLEGIERDGRAHEDSIVTFLPEGLLKNNALPSPRPLPVRFEHNRYLVAMLITSAGFHFMRRDTDTGLWCHKNGSFGAPEYTAVVRGPAGRLGRREVPITDDVALELLENQFGGRFEALGGGYAFAGYAVVPKAGIPVSGYTQRFD